ncbi:class II aldolase/adducin family protein [Saccharopolyspora phatthalungensis]|uniref:Ribulose-5-phosphate 4-epimerase/fuculose-1-phosphate aldolase n=1 Tax=Saccharopolyspora phatthalungensis TaxID=664693 RepID=A0A840QAJ2_9PSEU|nr:class II aldolase/adducin family protein [Saccharopolyspora phatthalungensis]MBB5156967.1 ribulose-5-phosphate 4-epimerase/fuculose-1-phosphate aldolase [Saccharopolyspora phatthalungensis]
MTAGASSVPGAAEVVEAAQVLARLGLVSAFGHVSVRAENELMITPTADLATVTPTQLVTVQIVPGVDGAALPANVPGEAHLHCAIYRARPDVTAVVRAQPESALGAGATATELPLLHGQAAWLGHRIPVHQSPRLIRDARLGDAAARSLGDNDALVLRGNGAVTTGTSPGEAVTRMWLLETACRIHLATRGADPMVLDDDDIAAWRDAAPPLLRRLWHHLRTDTSSRRTT